jgi:hypothetical protein
VVDGGGHTWWAVVVVIVVWLWSQRVLAVVTCRGHHGMLWCDVRSSGGVVMEVVV